MVLPVPYRIRTEVSVQNTGRRSSKRNETMYSGVYTTARTEIEELNIQIDHVHLLVNMSPKVSVSNFVGTLKGRTAIRVFNRFRNLKNKHFWGNHFWS
jgi:REP element-mobilizing transposase RayT